MDKCEVLSIGEFKDKLKKDKTFELLVMVNSLKAEVEVLVNIENGEMSFTQELKKDVQNSIKELCTTLLEKIV